MADIRATVSLESLDSGSVCTTSSSGAYSVFLLSELVFVVVLLLVLVLLLLLLFKMAPLIQDSDLDDETLDEQDYDAIQTTIMLDYIYALTKDNKCFQQMYDYASATMFSQDREIGLAVLFSFDYFIFFHPCICSYIKMPHRMSETNEYFIELLNRFIR